MGYQRQVYLSQDHKHGYKIHNAAHDSKGAAAQTRAPASLFYRTVAVAPSIMVSAWFLTKVFVAFAPLTSVYAQYNTSIELPLLLDATADELAAGLEAGAFTSLDLVQVRTPIAVPHYRWKV
jgi:hypothetical protein